MKCSIMFPGKNKKNISMCCLLKILPRVLGVKKKKKDEICVQYLNMLKLKS